MPFSVCFQDNCFSRSSWEGEALPSVSWKSITLLCPFLRLTTIRRQTLVAKSETHKPNSGSFFGCPFQTQNKNIENLNSFVWTSGSFGVFHCVSFWNMEYVKTLVKNRLVFQSLKKSCKKKENDTFIALK